MASFYVTAIPGVALSQPQTAGIVTGQRKEKPVAAGGKLPVNERNTRFACAFACQPGSRSLQVYPLLILYSSCT